MKRILSIAMLLLALGLFPLTLHSQTSNTDGRITGSFELNIAGAPQAVTAHYTLKPSGPDNIVLHMTASGEFTVNARIVDSRGKELMRFNAASVMPRYVSNIDISKLAPGQYFVEVLYGDKNEKAYRIPFTRG